MLIRLILFLTVIPPPKCSPWHTHTLLSYQLWKLRIRSRNLLFMLCMLSGNFCIIMRYDFDGSKSATIFLARLSAIIERSTIHYGRGCRSQVSMLIKSIDRKIPLACSRFHACTSQRVVRTHRHGELELCNNTKKKTCCSYAWVYRKIQQRKVRWEGKRTRKGQMHFSRSIFNLVPRVRSLFRLSLSAIYLLRFYPRYFENGFWERSQGWIKESLQQKFQ